MLLLGECWHSNHISRDGLWCLDVEKLARLGQHYGMAWMKDTAHARFSNYKLYCNHMFTVQPTHCDYLNRWVWPRVSRTVIRSQLYKLHNKAEEDALSSREASLWISLIISSLSLTLLLGLKVCDKTSVTACKHQSFALSLLYSIVRNRLHSVNFVSRVTLKAASKQNKNTSLHFLYHVYWTFFK